MGAKLVTLTYIVLTSGQSVSENVLISSTESLLQNYNLVLSQANHVTYDGQCQVNVGECDESQTFCTDQEGVLPKNSSRLRIYLELMKCLDKQNIWLNITHESTQDIFQLPYQPHIEFSLEEM